MMGRRPSLDFLLKRQDHKPTIFNDALMAVLELMTAA